MNVLGDVLCLKKFPTESSAVFRRSEKVLFVSYLPVFFRQFVPKIEFPLMMLGK